MRLSLLHVFAFFLLLPQNVWAAVLAIDYGNDWTKASLMSPGLPFDVLLDKDSKRKMQSTVGWKRSERVFGADAFNLASRFPKDSFSSVKVLQGAPFDSSAVSFYKNIAPSTELVETSRGTVALQQSDGTEWTVEELVAMQFSYIKQLADAAAGEPVQDVIVTVPPFYSQRERDAVVDAIEIAGLRTLALINDGTAAAINYAMGRSFSEPEVHVVFDAGASSVHATVVRFSPLPDGDGTQLTVLGVGYDRHIGGAELDRRVRELLIDAFRTAHPAIDIWSDARAMARLWKEAGRIKTILSANADAHSSVESLIRDIDFRTTITRAAFEDACADIRGRFTQPITDALTNARVSVDNVTSLLFVGGSTRVPMVQAAVKAAVGEDKIAKHVNADEAIVLGAALHGAALSRQFRTKNIKVHDITAHEIRATYYGTGGANLEARPRALSTPVFQRGSKTGTTKTVTFRRKDDFTVFLEYKQEVALGFPLRISDVDIMGVAGAVATLKERGAADPVVRASMKLSDSGFISIVDAVAHGDIKDDSIAGKLKGFFAGTTSSEEDGATAEVPEESTSSASSSASVAPSASASAPSLAELSTIPLNITVRYDNAPLMSAKDKTEAQRRLRAIDHEETAQARREEARNTFESYLYKLRELLDDESPSAPFRKCSQETERSAIADQLALANEWLHEYGDEANTMQFLEQRSLLEALERPIAHRYQEIEAFPQALNNSQMWNWSTRLFLADARANLTADLEAGIPARWTSEELDGLERTLKEHETWLGEWVGKQRKVKVNEDPVIETTEMRARAKVLEQQLQKLYRRKTPPRPKKTSTSSPSSTSTVTIVVRSHQQTPSDREEG
ncbi:HSP70-domain-containing protein [Fistulina hepatica ATCC 64428]|uniref:HSP70-domain-containing protein n=1 Tax=Fistulina hepatica ATCC 64428 TaxID=1128425 RepID=A0A0D7ACD6_9AGAR|nr:HSP70-domain-containing protein [Fistulina hepatica ATCC 64428]